MRSIRSRCTSVTLALSGAALLLAAADADESKDASPAGASAGEVERALDLTPDVANGLRIYRACADCHHPEGWGRADGSYPQLAGQHRKVVIKQLADIRAGLRGNPEMYPFASAERIGGAQAVADVAGYIDTLEISVDTGKGPGGDLARGESLYRARCAHCHGRGGEGDGDRYVPRIQSQHYAYLVRQLTAIREGRRGNADPEMTAHSQDLTDPEARAIVDYVSRLEPPDELQAPPGWTNPDFPPPGPPQTNPADSFGR